MTRTKLAITFAGLLTVCIALEVRASETVGHAQFDGVTLHLSNARDHCKNGFAFFAIDKSGNRSGSGCYKYDAGSEDVMWSGEFLLIEWDDDFGHPAGIVNLGSVVPTVLGLREAVGRPAILRAIEDSAIELKPNK